MSKRFIYLFAGTTLIVALGVFFLISATTPLTTIQAVGIGVAFAFGWLGLAYAGGEALAGMMRRRARLSSRDIGPERSDAAVRRLVRLGIAKPRPLDVPVLPTDFEPSKVNVTEPVPRGSAQTATARAEIVAKRYSREGAVPELPLQREAIEAQSAVRPPA